MNCEHLWIKIGQEPETKAGQEVIASFELVQCLKCAEKARLTKISNT